MWEGLDDVCLSLAQRAQLLSQESEIHSWSLTWKQNTCSWDLWSYRKLRSCFRQWDGLCATVFTDVCSLSRSLEEMFYYGWGNYCLRKSLQIHTSTKLSYLFTGIWQILSNDSNQNTRIYGLPMANNGSLLGSWTTARHCTDQLWIINQEWIFVHSFFQLPHTQQKNIKRQ